MASLATTPDAVDVTEAALLAYSDYHFRRVEQTFNAARDSSEDLHEWYFRPLREFEHIDEVPGPDYFLEDETTFVLSRIVGLWGVQLQSLADGGAQGTRRQRAIAEHAFQSGSTRELLLLPIAHLIWLVGQDPVTLADWRRMDVDSAWMDVARRYVSNEVGLEHVLEVAEILVRSEIDIGAVIADEFSEADRVVIPGTEVALPLSRFPQVAAMLQERDRLGAELIDQVHGAVFQ